MGQQELRRGVQAAPRAHACAGGGGARAAGAHLCADVRWAQHEVLVGGGSACGVQLNGRAHARNHASRQADQHAVVHAMDLRPCDAQDLPGAHHLGAMGVRARRAVARACVCV